MGAPLPESEETQIVVEYLAGKTSREIGAALGRSKTTISNVLRRKGVPLRPAKARDNSGPKNPAWKGGIRTDADGYVHQWTPHGRRRQHHVVLGVPPGTIVHHKDHNPGNNDPSNLEVLESHAAHRRVHVAAERAANGIARHPPPMRGEANPKAKLTAADVVRIRELSSSMTGAAIARMYGVTRTTVNLLLQGKLWTCVADDRVKLKQVKPT